MRGVFELQTVTYYTGNYTESYCQYLETLQVVTDLSEKSEVNQKKILICYAQKSILEWFSYYIQQHVLC